MTADPITIFKHIGWHAAASESHTEDVKVERLRCPLPVLKESPISSHGSMGTVDGHLFLQVECIPERYYSCSPVVYSVSKSPAPIALRTRK